jgi:hypothetical protein
MNKIEWNYDDLYQLAKDIDQLLDRAGHEDEALWQEQVRSSIRGLAINLGIHADFLEAYSEACKANGLTLTVKA